MRMVGLRLGGDAQWQCGDRSECDEWMDGPFVSKETSQSSEATAKESVRKKTNLNAKLAHNHMPTCCKPNWDNAVRVIKRYEKGTLT